ncbi:unnamed protein product [Owenia fusiformis]|uniref:Uncharacterized protein n=1 Tax=Owenia fusiformis TaxID=6347 RepID=A0A8J1TD93_OWEFU|nr:unnamed protein product [Owenia fusiformis]
MASVEANLQEMLTCQICFDSYTLDPPKHPKALPCLHTFCLSCLEQFQGHTSVECPSCRRSHEIPKDGFHTHFHFLSLLDTPARKSTLVQPMVRQKLQLENKCVIHGLSVGRNDDVIAVRGRTIQIYDAKFGLKDTLRLKQYIASATLMSDAMLVIKETASSTLKILNMKGDYQGSINNPKFSKSMTVANGGCNKLVIVKQNMVLYLESTDNIQWVEKACIQQSFFQLMYQHKFFEAPWYATVNSKGILIVSDHHRHCIRGLNKQGTDVFCYMKNETSLDNPGDENPESKLHWPRGICVDVQDYIIVADHMNQQVALLSPKGDFIRYLLTKQDGVRFPRSVVVNNNGQLIVGDDWGQVFVVEYRKYTDMV